MNKYTKMQKDQYDKEANNWSIDKRDPVVGSFDLHNQWKDYDNYLFRDIKLNNDMSCLDFGCGPGRNIAKYNNLFSRFDGVDISEINLKNAELWLMHEKCSLEKTNLILCNGTDLENINNDTYDVLMSTIAFQHISVYDIRKHYLKEFYRVLKKNGHLTMQMGFGFGHPYSVDYYENHVNATLTNGGCDTRVESPQQLEKDLYEVGFKDFKFYITSTGPGDGHPNWIFFNCTK